MQIAEPFLVQFFLNFSLFIIVLFLSCNADYENFKPQSVIEANVTIKDNLGKNLSTPFLFSIPVDYSPKKTWPLLIELHGYGSNARAFIDLWKSVSDSSGFVLLTPQGEVSVANGFGYGWGSHSKKIILSSLEILNQKVRINPFKIYLTGFSQGGSLTYQIGLENPQIFAGLAPLGASFSDSLYQQDTASDKPLKIYIGHGELEKNFANAEMAKRILLHMGHLVEFHSYKNVEHGLPELIKSELDNILTFFENHTK